MSDGLEKFFEVANVTARDVLASYNLVVARKLELVFKQLSDANSIEQFQQIGILIRDAWIEFAQNIYTRDFLPSGEPEPSPTDVKELLSYSLKNLHEESAYLLETSKKTYDLALKLQHDRNAKKQIALQCLTATGLLMLLILDSMLDSKLISKRPYYKCPNCGSIRLHVEDEWIEDIDHAFRVDKWICEDCGWYYIEELGGMSGVDKS